METLILILSLWPIRWLTNHYLFPTGARLMMAPILAQVLIFLIMGGLTLAIVLILTIIKAIGQCPKEKKSWGFVSGLRNGLISAITAGFGLFLSVAFPFLLTPFISLSILPFATEIGEGFYWALGGFYGYWMSQLFLGLCWALVKFDR